MANTLKFGNGVWANKKGSTLAYNDESGNFKPLPFTTTRSTSATRVNKEGLIEVVSNDVPRVDYTDSEDGALLLEPTRSNLVTYSEDFSNAYWEKSGSSVVSGFTSPKGDLNAFKLVENSATQAHYAVTQTVTQSEYNFSVFAKKSNRFIQLSGNLTVNDFVNFDLSDGTIGRVGSGTSNAKIEEYTNGWYRCSVTTTLSKSVISLATSSTSSYIASYQGNGTSGVYIYGAQLEQGSYPTSYIPTNGQANGVTRVADSSSQTVPSGVIGQTEGTLYTELGNIPSQAIDDVFVELSDGTQNGNNRILFYNDSNGYIRNQIKASGSISSLINTNVTVSSDMKIAITYKSNEAKVFINGVQYGGTDTSVVVPFVSKINLENFTGTRLQSSSIRDLKLYNTILTDQELIALTTI